MRSRLAQKLVESGKLQPADAQRLAHEARNDLELAEALVREGLVEAKTVTETRAAILGLSSVEINPYSIDPEVVRNLPEDLARKTLAIPLFRVGNDLTLAMADPTDVVSIDTVRDATGCDVMPVVATRADIENAINQFYGVDPLLDSLVSEAQRTEAASEAAVRDDEMSLADLAGHESPIIRIVNLVILKSIRDGASDVHVEPDHDYVRLRYRIDGRLESEQRLPLSLHPGIVSRLKILADLDLAQKRLPQDGRISLQAEGRRIDLRISTLPTIRGEKVVMRLLDTQSTLTTVSELGLAARIRSDWDELIHRPHGILLVTGPTGSGKTTTLYASLAAINELDTNIVTVEDPVEYDFPVINQVQVNPKAGLTFSSALRSILRQDPNIIMIGEIRDRETAQIAIRAALTGHLVLSTLHTNDATSAATRLIDMGVEPYLVASALKGVLAQRLVRRVCSRCVEFVDVDPNRMPPEVYERILRSGRRVKQGKGCRNCKDTGYRGRIALHELLTIDDEIERAIVRQLPAAEIRAIARRRGMADLFDDGLRKAQEGHTSLEQVLLATRMSEEEDADEAAAAPVTPAAAATVEDPDSLELEITHDIVEILEGPGGD